MTKLRGRCGYKSRLVILSLSLLFTGSVGATTWNEPWHEQVMNISDSFIKVRITEVQPSSCKADVLKLLGGVKVPERIELAGYSGLTISSTSGGAGELRLPFQAGEIYYLFVKKNSATDKYQIPTPTAGWANIQAGNVRATYRHSYHKALVPEDIYVKTMQAIFEDTKGRPYEAELIKAFVKEQLNFSVAVLTEGNQAVNQRFFLQHVALETFYYLRQGVDLPMLIPFLESEGFHVQISACRAVSVIDSPASRELLMKYIEGKGGGFAKVMCVWGLKRLKAKEMTARLQAFIKNGADQETGFGGSIMDPRIATFFPDSVKAAVNSLLSEWARPVSTSRSTPPFGARITCLV